MLAHNVSFHLYADDTQIYLPVPNLPESKAKLQSLLNDIRLWMNMRKLKLNESKTEVILIKGSKRYNLDENFELNFGENIVPTSKIVRNIGVTLDPSLSFDKHLNNIVRDCNFHLRNFHTIKFFLDRQSLVILINALITSRIDYYNSLFAGLPNKQLKKVQLILHRAARLIFSVCPRERITPYLIELHWLPVKARIEYKICLLVYKILKYQQPVYLVDLIKPYESESIMSLRAANDPFRLTEPNLVGSLTSGMRSFTYLAPRLYNQVPISIKLLTCPETFKCKLKSYFFTKSYDLDTNTIRAEYQVM